MKFVWVLMMLTLLAGSGVAQGYDVGGGGMGSNTPFLISSQQVNTMKYTRLEEGSPFLYDAYKPASVQAKKGQIVKQVNVKLNLVDQELYFIDKSGTELVLTNMVEYVEFSPEDGQPALRFSFFAKNAEGQPWGWMQLLAQGASIQLYKRQVKTVEETTPIGSATKVQKILTSIQYYALAAGQWTRLKKMEDVAELPGVRKDEVLECIKKNKLKAKADADWLKLISVL